MSRERSQRVQPLIPPAGGVAVRMYRQGLGDCFLLAFATAKPRQPTYVLIDCGVHGAQKNGRANIDLIVEDVIATTGGRLDTLVVTHEHIDHLSAFVTAQDRIGRFKAAADEDSEGPRKLRFKHLWLGWTENPDDSLAQSLVKKRQQAERALAAAVARLEEQVQRGLVGAMEAGALRQGLQSALSFMHLNAPLEADASAEPALSRSIAGQSAYKLLRECAGDCSYLVPGQPPLPIPNTAAARAYVLGPPRDTKRLKKSDPSSGEAQETYLAPYLTAATGVASFAAAALGASGADTEEQPEPGAVDHNELCNPFGREYRLPYDEAEESGFFQKYYGPDQPHHEHAWRQIESDWLFAAEQLALDLDHHTNNTSLALAFELGPVGQGDVLLFVADAQVGSWLSWGDLTWNTSPPVDMASLFARTVLYKVGHHASHNATLRRDAQGNAYGLELMPGRLIAMIPVDAAAASKLRGWHMPAANLYDALLRKARGNVLRSDEADDVQVPTTRKRAVPGCRGVAWRQSRAQKAAGDGPLYYDVFLRPPAS